MEPICRPDVHLQWGKKKKERNDSSTRNGGFPQRYGCRLTPETGAEDMKVEEGEIEGKKKKGW